MTGAGIGMGYGRLATSPEGTLRFFWNLTTSAETGLVALGLAL